MPAHPAQSALEQPAAQVHHKYPVAASRKMTDSYTTIGQSSFDPLIALVCGFEKSGTTLLNEILRRHPDLDSGFEGGFLLGASPRDFRNFQPYYAYFRQTWELSRADMLYICDTDSWGECYR